MKKIIGIGIIIAAIVVFFFRPYFFSHKLLFPSNLLVGFYSPWNTMKVPGWEGGIPFKGLGHDNLLIFYPMKQLLRLAIAERSLPIWTPYNFTGGPLFGDGQSALMYPLTYLYALLPLPDAFSVMVLVVPALTMLWTYGMFRHFRLSRMGALFGAVAFSFSGFMSVWMEENPAVSQSALWLPLLVWVLDLLIVTPKRRWFVLFAIATAIMMSSGFLQICLYELVFLAGYGIFRIWTLPGDRRSKWGRLGTVMLSGVSGLLLVSPYLITTWEAYKLSPRDFVHVPEIRSIFLVQWSHILSLFNPDWIGNPGSYNYHGVGSYYDKALFIGVVPLVFVLFGLFRKKSTWDKFFYWATLGTLLMGFSSPFTQWLFSLPIPILSSMLPSRIFYLTSFSLSVIAACTFDAFHVHGMEKECKKHYTSVISVYLGIIILLEVFLLAYVTELGLPSYWLGQIAHLIRTFIISDMKVTSELMSILLRNVGISIGLTVMTLGSLSVKRKFVWPILLLVTIISGWYFANKSFYFGERQFVYPNHELLVALQKIAGNERIAYANEGSRIRSSINVIYGLYSVEGLNPVFPYRYGQLVQSSVNNGFLTTDIPRISVDVDLERASVDASASARINRLLSLLGVRYVTERKESGWYRKTFPRHVSVWEGEKFRIWENPDVLPHAFVTDNVIMSQGPQQTLDLLYDKYTQLEHTAIVEEPILIARSAQRGNNISSSATITSYRMSDLTIAVESTRAGMLILTDAYAPGWRAQVDGKDSKVVRVDFAFRGIPIEKGSHVVRMWYWPDSLTIGLWGMVVGLVLLIAGSIF